MKLSSVCSCFRIHTRQTDVGFFAFDVDKLEKFSDQLSNIQRRHAEGFHKESTVFNADILLFRQWSETSRFQIGLLFNLSNCSQWINVGVECKFRLKQFKLHGMCRPSNCHNYTHCLRNQSFIKFQGGHHCTYSGPCSRLI